MKYPPYVKTKANKFWFNVGRVIDWSLAFAIIILFIILVSGCVSAWPPQNYAGVSHMIIHFDEQGNVSRLENISGKESADADFTLTNDGGTVIKVSAKGLKAFKGHASRANVETALSKAGIEPDPTLVDLILDAIATVN